MAPPSVRRAWIEIPVRVAPETGLAMSPSARRAWVGNVNRIRLLSLSVWVRIGLVLLSCEVSAHLQW